MATSKKGGATIKQASDTERVEQETRGEIRVKIDRLFNNPDKPIRAVANANLPGGFAVRGIRLFENEKGFWINTPQRAYTDQNGETKYEDIFFPVTKEAREQLHGAVKEAYDQALVNAQSNTQQQQSQPQPEPAEQVQKM